MFHYYSLHFGCLSSMTTLHHRCHIMASRSRGEREREHLNQRRQDRPVYLREMKHAHLTIDYKVYDCMHKRNMGFV